MHLIPIFIIVFFVYWACNLEEAKADPFLQAIQQVETGGLVNPHIRTRVFGSGSSAYGKYQLTRTLALDYLNRYPSLFTDEHREALSEVAERQHVALKVGGSDRIKFITDQFYIRLARTWSSRYGFEKPEEFLDAFDYGGSLGIKKNSKLLKHYYSAVEVILQHTLTVRARDQPHKAAAIWYGGDKFNTYIYVKKFLKYYEKFNEASKSN